MKRGVKKAQGQIITIVMLILLVLALVVIVWTVASGFVNKNVEGIDSAALNSAPTIKGASEIFETIDNEEVFKGIKVIVKRDGGKGEIKELIFTFNKKGGGNEVITIDGTGDCKIPGPLEEKVCNFFSSDYPTYDFTNLISVSVTPNLRSVTGATTTKDIEEDNVKNNAPANDDPREYFRLADNACSSVTIRPSEETSNDYDTLAKCQKYINDDPREYFRLADNACSSVTIRPSEKTSNDYDTEELCVKKIVQLKKYVIDMNINGDCAANVLTNVGARYDWWKHICRPNGWGNNVVHNSEDLERYITCTWDDKLPTTTNIIEILIDPIDLAVYEEGGLADWYLNSLKLLDDDDLGNVGNDCSTTRDFPEPFSTTQGSAYNLGASNSIIINKQGGGFYVLAPGKIEVTVTYTE